MEQTLRQVGELLLSAIPTLVLLVLTYVAYRALVHGKLEQVLQERHARTEGAIEKARADVAAAEAKTAEYEQRLREARAAVYRSQEARRQQALQARAAAVEQARRGADAQVKAARQALDHDVAAAKASLAQETEKLAEQIIRTIFRAVAVTPAGGAR